MIDGAHALGQLDLDIASLDVDYYVTNCHKWFCNTRGSALLHVRRELQPSIQPLVSSFGYKKGFVAKLEWMGKCSLLPLDGYVFSCCTKQPLSYGTI